MREHPLFERKKLGKNFVVIVPEVDAKHEKIRKEFYIGK
jgi:hypothetical protein